MDRKLTTLLSSCVLALGCGPGGPTAPADGGGTDATVRRSSARPCRVRSPRLREPRIGLDGSGNARFCVLYRADPMGDFAIAVFGPSGRTNLMHGTFLGGPAMAVAADGTTHVLYVDRAGLGDQRLFHARL
jgi:hypothetical protein